MGMAASQARYLGLTARKTNVEYEGQQVNQARTALANQSANTFNDLLALEVPTAPSTQDYTTLQYSYQDGLNSETISSMSDLINDPDGYNYLITHYHYSDVYTGIMNMKSNPQVVFDTRAQKGTVPKDQVKKAEDGENKYTVNDKEVTKYAPTDEQMKSEYSKILQEYPDFSKVDVENVYTYTGDDGKIYFTDLTSLKNASDGKSDLVNYSISEDVPAYVGNSEVHIFDPTDSTMKAAYEQICRDFPSEGITSGNIYTWEYQGQTYFATYDDLKASAESAPDKTKPSENQIKLRQYYAQNVKTKIEQQQKAFVDLDESGRPQSIRFEDNSATYALSTETITDETAYEDAMNQYNYDMQVYEKKIADINAKTQKIQEQDRTLELRLRQLDTEQEALQTEMEAVKKVIEKNIESTFKTFE